MIITVRVNDSTTFPLVRWNALDFNANLTLYIQSIDLLGVRNAFENIEKIEILQDDALAATYTVFDGVSQISYMGKEFVEGEKKFADSLAVTLTRTNIVEQVQRLDQQINPVIDTDAMDLTEYKKYRIQQASAACAESIYSGDQVTLSDGHVETFTFDVYDQPDLLSLANLAMMDPKVELTWHSTGNPCKFYSGLDIIIIYQTLNMKLFRETTIFNAINLLIKNAQSKDEVDLYYWGCELPAAEAERVNGLISRMQAIVMEIMAKFMPVVPDDPTPSEETPEEPGENTDPEETPGE